MLARDIDMDEYLIGDSREDHVERFIKVAETYGLDRYIPSDRIREYMNDKDVQLDLEAGLVEYRSSLQNFLKFIESKENAEIADLFYKDFNEALIRMKAIKEAVEYDPVAYMVSTGGESIGEIEFLGLAEELENPFSLSRLNL